MQPNFSTCTYESRLFPRHFRGLPISRYSLPLAQLSKAKTARGQFERSGSDCARLRSREGIHCEIDRAARVSDISAFPAPSAKAALIPRALSSRALPTCVCKCANLRIDRVFLPTRLVRITRYVRTGESALACARSCGKSYTAKDRLSDAAVRACGCARLLHAVVFVTATA